MATRRKNDSDQWPKITVGSHSTRTEFQDGRVDFVIDWEALSRDVAAATTVVTSEPIEIKPKTKRSKKIKE